MKVISKHIDKARLNVPIFKNLHTDMTELNERTSYIGPTYSKHNSPSCKGMEINPCLNPQEITYRTHTQTQTNTHTHTQTHTHTHTYIYNV